jgi:hypothetical protein
MFSNQIEPNLKRYADCIALSEKHEPGTWPHDFWLDVAMKIKRNTDRQKLFVLGTLDV